jgi:hypothetical protein
VRTDGPGDRGGFWPAIAAVLAAAAAATAAVLAARHFLQLVGLPTARQKTLGSIVFHVASIGALLVVVVVGWRARFCVWPRMGMVLGVIGVTVAISWIAGSSGLVDGEVSISVVGAAAGAIVVLVLFLASFHARKALRGQRFGIFAVWSVTGTACCLVLYGGWHLATWFE